MINQLDDLKDTLFKYIETRVDIVKIETRGKIESTLIVAAYMVVVLCIFTVLATVIAILLAIYLNELLHSKYLGYVIVIGLLILKLAIWLVFRKQLSQVLRKVIVSFVHAKEEITEP